MTIESTTALNPTHPGIAEHAILTGDVYKGDPIDRGTGDWSTKGFEVGDHADSGLKAQAYSNDNYANHVVFAIAGTDGLTAGKDWLTNASFVRGTLSTQMSEALAYVAKIMDEAAKAAQRDGETPPTFSVTGHSLGGGIAQLIAYTFNIDGMALDAPGASKIAEGADYQAFVETLKTEYPDAFNNVGADAKTGDAFINIHEEGSLVNNLGGEHLGMVQEIDAVDSLIDPDSAVSLLLTAHPWIKIVVAAAMAHDVLNNHSADDLIAYLKNEYSGTLSEAEQAVLDSLYIVTKGDTLSEIAEANGLTLDELLALNPDLADNPDAIKIGQVITLKTPATQATKTTLTDLLAMDAATLKGTYGIDHDALDQTITKIQTGFARAERTSSPLVLDLDGDGVETLSKDSGIHFDLDANGFAELTGWASADDGLLVRDINGNGQIDNGRELFGDNTLLADGETAANGFEALAELDSNGDGQVDASDTNFDQLNIWQDSNSDGAVQEGELLSLDEAGVSAVQTTYSNSTEVDEQGNQHRQQGSYTNSEGTSTAVNDVWFSFDGARTVNLNTVEISDEIAALPDVQGFGNVASLRQVMAQDDSGALQSLVERFIETDDAGERHDLMDELVYHWVGVIDVDPSSRGVYVNAQELKVLEIFLGEGFFQGGWQENPTPMAGITLHKAFIELSNYIYSQLLIQSFYKDAFDLIDFDVSENGLSFSIDISGFKGYLEALVSEGELFYAADIMRMLESLNTQMSLGIDTQQIRENSVLLSVYGSVDNDSLVGGVEDDSLFGGLGDDSILSKAGHDTLVGGKGNDILTGGAGDDHYYWGLGDGNDTINDYDIIDRHNAEHQDTLIFGEGITAEDLAWSRSDNNLIASISDEDGGTQSLTLTGWFTADHYQVEKLQLADGTVLDKATIETSIVIFGTEVADGIAGFTDSNDRILGLAGNDYLRGNSGDDRLEGGADNDRLYGDAGNDTLLGGTGNDMLQGDSGDDTYHWGLGDGNDSITDYDNTDRNNAEHQDTLIFGEGIAAEDLVWSRNGNHLIASISDEDGSTQSLTLSNWFYADSWQVEQLQLADGTALDKTEIEASIVILGTEGNDYINYGYSSNDRILGLAGNDRLYGGAGDDRLEGGAGNDQLLGDTGNDTLIGGVDNDTLTGGAGDDTYHWGIGDGNDSITDYDNIDRNNAEHQDTLIFGEGIAAEDLVWSRSGNSLVATLTNDDGGTQSLTLSNWFAADYYQVEQLQLADGTVLDKAEIEASIVIMGTEGNDYLNYGYSSNDRILGLGGNDRLYGGAGDDRLEGGTGNDTLQGDRGDDTYHWGIGDGNDSINDYDNTDRHNAEHQDTLIFGEGIVAEGLVWSRSGNHLIASISDEDGGTQSLTLNNWFAADYYQVEQLQLADGTVLDKAEIEASIVILGTEGNDYLNGFANSNDRILGLAGNDILNGNSGDDRLEGGADNDRLLGGAGNDTLIGGTGNDTLQGDSGNDTYHWGIGDGNDSINDYDNTDRHNAEHQDTLIFGEGITAEDLVWSRSGNHLIASISDEDGGTQSLTLNNWFAADYYQVEQLQLADGTVLDKAEIEASIVIQGTEGNDYLNYGYSSNDRILGLARSDRLYGGAGDDRLEGGAGNDTLNGDTGNDTLIGGGDNDTLTGGAGDDTYHWGLGDGNDSINDYDGTDRHNAEHQDTLIFGEGITAEDLVWSRSGNHLVATLTNADDSSANGEDSSESLTLNNWFAADYYQIERLQLQDGTLLDKHLVEASVVL